MTKFKKVKSGALDNVRSFLCQQCQCKEGDNSFLEVRYNRKILVKKQLV